MPDVKMYKTMRSATCRIAGFVLLMAIAFATPSYAQSAMPPDLAAPVDQAQIIDTTSAIVLEWTEVAGATTYELQVYHNEPINPGDEPIALKTKVLSNLSHEILVSDLLAAVGDQTHPGNDNDSTFHWRVRAFNVTPDWSEVWEFSLVQLSTTPTWLALPVDGSEINEGEPFTFQVQAAGSGGASISYSIDAQAGSAGMTLDATTGEFSWTPSESQGPDMYSVTFTATNGAMSQDSTITLSVLEVNLAPVIIAPADTVRGFAGSELTFLVEATDADTLAPFPFTYNQLAFSLDNPPDAGMIIDAATGMFSWTPAQAGVQEVTIVVTDDGAPNLTGTQTVTLLVEEPPAPTWLQLPVDGSEINEEELFTFQVEASDAENDPITYSIDAVAEALGMTLDATTGDFSWMPSESQGPDAYAVTFSASDGLTSRDSTVTISVLEVNLAPAITALPDTVRGFAGSELTFLAEAMDPDTLAPFPFTYNQLAFSLDNPPDAGMSIDAATGIFTWTPPAPDTVAVTVVVTDDGVPALSDIRVVTLLIEAESCPRLESIDPHVVDEGETLELTLQASNACPAGTFTIGIDQASLDRGMVLDATTGALSWITGETDGPHSYTVTASVSDGSVTTTQDFIVTVNEVNQAPVLATIANMTAYVGVELGFVAVATDPDTLAPPPYTFNTWAFSLDNPPDPGMNIDMETGAFSWTPAQTGLVEVTVVVTDSGTPIMTDSQTLSITVLPFPPPPPVLPPPFEPQAFCAAQSIGSFQWSNPLDNQGGLVAVDTFIVEVSADPNFSTTVLAEKRGFSPQDSTSSADVDLSTLNVGPVYYWRVRAQAGNVESDPSETVSFRRWPAQITVQHTLPFSTASKSEDFRMISLPGASTVEIASTFAGQQAPSGPLVAGGDWGWSVWRDNGGDTAHPDYIENPILSSDTFEPGKGVWAISTSAWVVPQTSVNSVTVVNDRFFAIPLNRSPQSQWTMIGNPFDFPVVWQDILDANPDITGDETLWDWAGQRYDAATVLEPYKGYYYFNRDNLSELNMPCYLAPPAGKVAAREEPRIAALELSVHEDRDGTMPTLSDIRVSWREEAAQGLDRFDRYVPPAYFESHRISLFNENLGTDYTYLSEEARPSLDEAQSFELEFKSIPGQSNYLRVTGLESLAGREVYLFDETLGRSFNLHENPVVLLEPEQEISKFRLLVGDAEYISGEESRLLPEGFKMQQSYPNPFVDRTTIEYALPAPEFVTLEVYNVLGQRVRTLVRDDQDAGYHRVIWDGRSDAGDEVASGMYLYVLKSPSHHASERLVRVR